MKQILFILLLPIYFNVSAQTGAIRGRVIDNVTEQPIQGVSVVFVGDSSIATVTDNNGQYRLQNLPVGRANLRMNFIGYEMLLLSDISVMSGKDEPMDVRMTESFTNLAAVEINAKPRKDRALNQFARVSARQVSVEDITKYAGGRSDVARLAANFAGVSAPNDSRNDIVVRGNSPAGLLWRIEGIPVANPNHFSSLGTTGSPVSALNANVMANSDLTISYQTMLQMKKAKNGVYYFLNTNMMIF